MAAQGGHVDIVQILLDNGYDIDDVTMVCRSWFAFTFVLLKEN